jgi:lysophospholipase L1-like esterase
MTAKTIAIAVILVISIAAIVTIAVTMTSSSSSSSSSSGSSSDDDADSSSSSGSASSAFHVALIGDSDIDFWPESLLPSIEGATVSSDGHPGETLEQIVGYADAYLLENESDLLVLVACAGENDIGEEIPLAESERAFERLLEITFNRPDPENIRLIFLSPKFEPWLQDDPDGPDAREQYIEMTSAFQGYCNAHPMSRFISFINCLTMFCGESGQQPGAVLDGTAIAEQRFFDADQLHLGDEGYAIWKEVVQDNIQQLVNN